MEHRHGPNLHDVSDFCNCAKIQTFPVRLKHQVIRTYSIFAAQSDSSGGRLVPLNLQVACFCAGEGYTSKPPAMRPAFMQLDAERDIVVHLMFDCLQGRPRLGKIVARCSVDFGVIVLAIALDKSRNSFLAESVPTPQMFFKALTFLPHYSTRSRRKM